MEPEAKSQSGDPGGLDGFTPRVRLVLDSVHSAREAALPECRKSIRESSLAIRAIHRRNSVEFEDHFSKARSHLSIAQSALSEFPDIAGAGFLHDAEKEVAEARLTLLLIEGRPLEEASEIGVRLPAWLNGLCEAASEVRRAMLQELRQGNLEIAKEMYETMEEVLDFLSLVDYPDAITGGLRRNVDSLRAVVERSASDLTLTLVQERLRSALDKS